MWRFVLVLGVLMAALATSAGEGLPPRRLECYAVGRHLPHPHYALLRPAGGTPVLSRSAGAAKKRYTQMSDSSGPSFGQLP
jgi:hypothetical protein